MMKLIDKEDTVETFKCYWYIDGEAKWVIVDEKGDIVDKNPCEEDIYDKCQRRSNLDLLPIEPFPGMEYDDDDRDLFVLKGFVLLIEKEYNSFTMLVHDYKNPILFDPDGSFEDDGTQIFVRNFGDICLDELCPMMEITAYGMPNEEDSFITQNSLYRQRNEDNDYMFDGLRIETKERKVTIRGEDVPIDKCIANEIEELNNIHGIETVMSCCGHKKEKGFISAVVDNDVDKDKIISLGYQYVEDSSRSFFPLSDCKCDENVKIDEIIMRKCYHNDYWKH